MTTNTHTLVTLTSDPRNVGLSLPAILARPAQDEAGKWTLAVIPGDVVKSGQAWDRVTVVTSSGQATPATVTQAVAWKANPVQGAPDDLVVMVKRDAIPDTLKQARTAWDEQAKQAYKLAKQAKQQAKQAPVPAIPSPQPQAPSVPAIPSPQPQAPAIPAPSVNLTAEQVKALREGGFSLTDIMAMLKGDQAQAPTVVVDGLNVPHVTTTTNIPSVPQPRGKGGKLARS